MGHIHSVREQCGGIGRHTPGTILTMRRENNPTRLTTKRRRDCWFLPALRPAPPARALAPVRMRASLLLLCGVSLSCRVGARPPGVASDGGRVHYTDACGPLLARWAVAGAPPFGAPASVGCAELGAAAVEAEAAVMTLTLVRPRCRCHPPALTPSSLRRPPPLAPDAVLKWCAWHRPATGRRSLCTIAVRPPSASTAPPRPTPYSPSPSVPA